MSDHESRARRLDQHRYLFTSVWHLPTTRDAAFALLADVYRYPSWWPEFKTARPIDHSSGELSLRSALPITLRFTLHRDIEDPDNGHLRATADGDIAGSVEWRVDDLSGGTAAAHFSEDVILNQPLAAKLDRALQPLLKWNHRVAMRSGAANAALYLAAR